jgi:hypothetical protein
MWGVLGLIILVGASIATSVVIFYVSRSSATTFYPFFLSATSSTTEISAGHIIASFFLGKICSQYCSCPSFTTRTIYHDWFSSIYLQIDIINNKSNSCNERAP